MSRSCCSQSVFVCVMAICGCLTFATTSAFAQQQAGASAPSLSAIQVEAIGSESVRDSVDGALDDGSSRRPGRSTAPDGVGDDHSDLQEEVTRLLRDDVNSLDSEDADGSDSDQDDDGEDDESKDAAAPYSVPGVTITTDTRGLRVSINEADQTAPVDRSNELLSGMSQRWPAGYAPKVFAWAAPDIRYQPLYFEDVALERYGQTPCGCRETLLSAAHFFKSAALLPYQVLQDHPCACDGPLGFCRPGSAAPFTAEHPLYQLR